MIVKHVRTLARKLRWRGSQQWAPVFSIAQTQAAEVAYWEMKIAQEGRLTNDHYEFLYTTHFGLDADFYTGKRMLDIGCGPRGSLEWAHTTGARIGLDPLSHAYATKLGAESHAMSYVGASAERIPFFNDCFDVLTSFNSLDTVENVPAVIAEIKRLVKPGGTFLLIVEVNHSPTPPKPRTLPWSLPQQFTNCFDTLDLRKHEWRENKLYDQLVQDVRFNESDRTNRPGSISARFVKRTA